MSKLFLAIALLFAFIAITSAATYRVKVATFAPYTITQTNGACIARPTTKNGIKSSYIANHHAYITIETELPPVAGQEIETFKTNFKTCATALGINAGYTVPSNDDKCASATTCGATEDCLCAAGQVCHTYGNSACESNSCPESNGWKCTETINNVLTFYPVDGTYDNTAAITSAIANVDTSNVCRNLIPTFRKQYGKALVIGVTYKNKDTAITAPCQQILAEVFKVAYNIDTTCWDRCGSASCPCEPIDGSECFSKLDWCGNNDGIKCVSEADWSGRCTVQHQSFHITAQLKQHWVFEDFKRDLLESKYWKACAIDVASIVYTGNWADIVVIYSGIANSACSLDKLYENAIFNHYVDVEGAKIVAMDEALSVCVNEDKTIQCVHENAECSQVLCGLGAPCSGGDEGHAQCATGKCDKKKKICVANNTMSVSMIMVVVGIVIAILF